MRRQPLLLALILSLVLMGLVLLPTTPSWGASWVAEFTIGETKYVVNGQPFFMDVAPYIKNGRTYLPVRYVAYALGVPEGGIGYHDGVVTLMDDRVVQMTIGSKFLRVDAATISMDVAPVTRGSRTMLPLRWIAQAFGANVDWDPVYQKVTISLSEAQPVSQTSTGRVVRQNQPPQAPSGLYLVSIAQGSAGGSYYVTLQWDSVSDATGYRIYGRPSYGDKFYYLAQTETTIHAVTVGMSKNDYWEFYVTAVNSTGESLPSNTIRAMSPATTVPGAPSKVWITDFVGHRPSYANLYWEPVDCASYYRVYKSEYRDGTWSPWEIYTEVPSTQLCWGRICLPLTLYTTNTQYAFYVRAVNEMGVEGPPSQTVTIFIPK